MISKLEWQEWKSHKITRRLLELIEGGREAAIEEIISKRESVADFERGAIFSLADMTETILKGDGMYTEVEE